jgi:WD40 repeat protein
MIDPGASQGQVLAAETGMAVSVLGVAEFFLASGGQDGAVGIWAMPRGEAIEHLQFSGWIDRLVWSPDGQMLAIAVGREVVVWSQGIVARLAIETTVQDLAWSPDGSRLGVGTMGGVKLWQVGDWTGEPELIRLPTVVLKLAWSPDGQYLAMGNQDGTLVVVDWTAVDRPWVMRGLGGKVRQLVWWGEAVVISCLQDVVVWRLLGDLWEAQVLEGHDRSVAALAACAEMLVSGGDRVCLWDTAGALIGEMAVEATAVALFGNLLAVGQADGGLGLFAMAQRV